MVTTLKDTAKPVTDLAFPAITICASGLHMDNVERKLKENFAIWRADHHKNDYSREALEKDINDYMFTVFKIKSELKPVNILDILDTMIAPDVEASVAANGVRENALACQDEASAQSDDTHGRKKRQASSTYSCPNSTFKLSGNNCFGVSDHSLNFIEAVDACSALGAQLATIDSSEND